MAISPRRGNMTGRVQPVISSAGAAAVGRFVAAAAGKALSCGGTGMAGLLAQWAAISGPTLAAYTMPAKMTRAAPEPLSQGKPVSSLLHLKVDPAKALDVQYAVPQLIERINQALGYKAVAGIRLVQAPVLTRGKAPAASPPAPLRSQTPEHTSRTASALARLAAGLKAGSPAA